MEARGWYQWVAQIYRDGGVGPLGAACSDHFVHIGRQGRWYVAAALHGQIANLVVNLTELASTIDLKQVLDSD